MKTLLFSLLVLTLAGPAVAYEFKIIKLSPLLEKRQKELSGEVEPTLQKFQARKMSVLGSAAEIASDGASQVEETLYSKILGYLAPNYQSIAQNQVNPLLSNNSTFNLGEKNFSGFSWQKPMGSFTIGIDRQLAPDLFSDTSWIVTDKLVVGVDAYTYLKNLRDGNGPFKINIPDATLGLFAGVEFSRTYTYTHFAPTFMKGLVSDYDKLFLSFLRLNPKQLKNLAPYESITQEDHFKARVGGLLTIPTTTAVSFNVGAFISKELFSKIELVAVGPDDAKRTEDEAFRISFQKESSNTTEAQADLQVEFFELLKLTLLSYEYSYSSKDSHTIDLSFENKDLEDTNISGEIGKLLKLKSYNETALAPYVISRERKTTLTEQSKYGLLLLFGGLKKGQTEQIIVEKDKEQKRFFKTAIENIKYVKGALTAFLETVSDKLLKLNLFNGTQSARTRRLVFEYDGTRLISTNFQDAYVKSPSEISLTITHQFSSKETEGFMNSQYRDYGVNFLRSFTTITPDIVSALKNDKLVGPIEMSSTFNIKSGGLAHLKNLKTESLYPLFAKFCNWDIRVKYLDHRKLCPGSQGCRCFKGLAYNHKKFKDGWDKNGDLFLFNLKGFLDTMLSYSDNKDQMELLFGKDNLFNYGTFKAASKRGPAFTTYFKDGNLTSLGVIEDYKRSGSTTRAPASVELN